MDLHELATLLAGESAALRLRQGEVTAVPGDGTIAVKIGGSDVELTGVKCLTSLSPSVGAGVWLLSEGADLLAIGAVGPPAAGSGGPPAGTGMDWWGGSGSIPAGWLACFGQSLLRADYPTLFEAIGTTFGAADGSHFSLPDTRDRFLVSAGSGYALNQKGGSSSHGHGPDGAHGHSGATDSGSTPDHLHGAGSLNAVSTATAGINRSTTAPTAVCTQQSHTHAIGGSTGAADRSLAHAHGVAALSGGAHSHGAADHRPYYIAVFKIIKT